MTSYLLFSFKMDSLFSSNNDLYVLNNSKYDKGVTYCFRLVSTKNFFDNKLVSLKNCWHNEAQVSRITALLVVTIPPPSVAFKWES